MRQRIARLISSLLNPFLVSFITIVIIVLDSTASVASALKWTTVALALSVVPVFIFVLVQIKRKKLDSIFPETQAQRKTVYILASVLAAVGCAVMWLFKAPGPLAACFTAGLAAIIVFMAINLYWKISLHTAFISAAATMLTLTFGFKAAWLFVLLPLVGWARLELKLHTPAQVAAGAFLAAVIVTATLWGFGVVVV